MEKVVLVLAFVAVLAATATSVQSSGPYDIIVVRGDIPTDYIVASIYSSNHRIPLVLVNPDSMGSETRQEFAGYRKIGYERMLIIGGQDAISVSVEDDLKGIGFNVDRLWDWNRYGTAARVSIELWGSSESIIVTNGESYDGFLVAQKIALERGGPILFIKNSTVTDETADAIRRLGASSAVLIGTDAGAKDALGRLGLSVETVETAAVGTGSGKEDQGMLYYILLPAAALLLAAALVAVYLGKGKKARMLLMTEDDEKIVEILKLHGKTEQNRFSELTGFSKPKVSRMLKSLQERGIIERERHKKTYKIKLRHNM